VTDRVALITGGNRGIGLEICRGLAELEHRVAMGSRDAAAGAQALADLDQRIRERVMVVPLDVTVAESARQAMAQLQARWGPIDVLVNNAGVYLDEGVPGLSVPTELQGSGVFVNAVDPGWVRTRMGGRSASRSPRQGADTAIYLATLPATGPTGGFFRDRRQIPW
jgi:NAD(P)-dependent dehydrogenase (short-subunit alcohol dehydrogenase family)